MTIQIRKKTEKEKVAYLVGKYFINQLTLKNLKIQIEALSEEPLVVLTGGA